MQDGEIIDPADIWFWKFLSGVVGRERAAPVLVVGWGGEGWAVRAAIPDPTTAILTSSLSNCHSPSVYPARSTPQFQ